MSMTSGEIMHIRVLLKIATDQNVDLKWGAALEYFSSDKT